jgi:hypothetical protein
MGAKSGVLQQGFGALCKRIVEEKGHDDAGVEVKPSKLTVVAQGGEALARRLDTAESRRAAPRQPFNIAVCDLP